jgi:hypothetical protein
MMNNIAWHVNDQHTPRLHTHLRGATRNATRQPSAIVAFH